MIQHLRFVAHTSPGSLFASAGTLYAAGGPLRARVWHTPHATSCCARQCAVLRAFAASARSVVADIRAALVSSVIRSSSPTQMAMLALRAEAWSSEDIPRSIRAAASSPCRANSPMA